MKGKGRKRGAGRGETKLKAFGFPPKFVLGLLIVQEHHLYRYRFFRLHVSRLEDLRKGSPPDPCLLETEQRNLHLTTEQ